MSNILHFIGKIILFVSCFMWIQNAGAQTAMQGSEVFRGLDNTSRTGATELTVSYDNRGNATIQRKEIGISSFDLQTLNLFVPRSEITNFSGRDNSQKSIRINSSGSSDYWLIDFGSNASARMLGNTLEVSCSCIQGGGSCNVVHTQQGDIQQTFCEVVSSCTQCKLEVSNQSQVFQNSVLLIQANEVNFE